MSAKNERLGILAGEGQLPVRLVDYATHHNIPVCMVRFSNCHYDTHPDIAILETRLEKVGTIFDFLKKQAVSHVVMIGHLQKPDLSSLRPDLKGLKTLAAIGKAYLAGDDDLLRSLRREIEKQGITVVSIDHYLDDLTVNAGVLTKSVPLKDYSDGVEEALRFGSQDKGQSILVHRDGTYSYETRDGTTALINTHGRAGSVLVKMIKPQQDPDLDRPTVGVDTIRALHQKNCAGVVIQADGVFVVDQQAVIDAANHHGLFIEAVNV